MQGWNVVLTEHRLDTTWQVLQHTDQQLLPTYGTAQRLAVLYVMKLQLHYLLTDKYIPGTPSFLHASQAITKGSSATLPTSNITYGQRIPSKNSGRKLRLMRFLGQNSMNIY
ncbi:hypothetical protein CISG_05902 [Coccidioides immitis RMSCC 3703]|uniref:Uncharacterized protein n=1 Tax=Coccidioides immitis RMSCC 3703 TaxID=454286 RepID=A0A0J8QV69_COCIT|nr:hypothetical protein CISG_05902 [Coccidioides immitis RMSCC 3703]